MMTKNLHQHHFRFKLNENLIKQRGLKISHIYKVHTKCYLSKSFQRAEKCTVRALKRGLKRSLIFKIMEFYLGRKWTFKQK